MARIIPNANTWIGWLPLENMPDPDNFDKNAPTEADVAAAYDLSCYTMSVNASSTGNTVPTPSLCSLFETTINGTVSATFQAEFYRDNGTDSRYPELCYDPAWTVLPRGVCGYFILKWYGAEQDQCSFEAAAVDEASAPVNGDAVQVWPIKVTSRTASALSSGTVMTFSVTGAVIEIPSEEAAVGGARTDCPDGSGTGTPGSTVSAPRDVSGSANSDDTVSLAWRIPETGGALAVRYDVFVAQDGGTYQLAGNTTNLSWKSPEAFDPGKYTFKVAAYDAAGNRGASSAPSNEVTIS